MRWKKSNRMGAYSSKGLLIIVHQIDGLIRGRRGKKPFESIPEALLSRRRHALRELKKRKRYLWKKGRRPGTAMESEATTGDES